jgi:hypothetical protein
LFEILKRAKKHQPRDDILARGVDHTLPLFPAYEQATASMTVMASWPKSGFDYENHDETRCLIVNEAIIRQATAFREIWEFDYDPARLSPQRMSQRGGG